LSLASSFSSADENGPRSLPLILAYHCAAIVATPTIARVHDRYTSLTSTVVKIAIEPKPVNTLTRTLNNGSSYSWLLSGNEQECFRLVPKLEFGNQAARGFYLTFQRVSPALR
jgi:hypothetical protein